MADGISALEAEIQDRIDSLQRLLKQKKKGGGAELLLSPSSRPLSPPRERHPHSCEGSGGIGCTCQSKRSPYISLGENIPLNRVLAGHPVSPNEALMRHKISLAWLNLNDLKKEVVASYTAPLSPPSPSLLASNILRISSSSRSSSPSLSHPTSPSSPQPPPLSLSPKNSTITKQHIALSLQHAASFSSSSPSNRSMSPTPSPAVSSPSPSPLASRRSVSAPRLSSIPSNSFVSSPSSSLAISIPVHKFQHSPHTLSDRLRLHSPSSASSSPSSSSLSPSSSFLRITTAAAALSSFEKSQPSSSPLSSPVTSPSNKNIFERLHKTPTESRRIAEAKALQEQKEFEKSQKEKQAKLMKNNISSSSSSSGSAKKRSNSSSATHTRRREEKPQEVAVVESSLSSILLQAASQPSSPSPASPPPQSQTVKLETILESPSSPLSPSCDASGKKKSNKSKRVKSSKPSKPQIWDKLYKDGKEKMEYKNTLSDDLPPRPIEEIQEEEREMTFCPRISDYAKQISNTVETFARLSDMEAVRQKEAWRAQRQEAEFTRTCSFSPQRSSRPSSPLPQRPVSPASLRPSSPLRTRSPPPAAARAISPSPLSSPPSVYSPPRAHVILSPALVFASRSRPSSGPSSPVSYTPSADAIQLNAASKSARSSVGKLNQVYMNLKDLVR